MQPTNQRHHRLGWVARAKRYSQSGPKRKKRHGERRSQNVWGRAKKRQCCYLGQTMCLDKMEWYRTNKLSWKSVIAMEPLAISFLLRPTYDLVPNATNLKLWGYTNSDLCLSCKSDRGTLRHVLSACPQ